MGKRISGAPRRPRNPVAKAVRSPLCRPQVVPDKRGRQPGSKQIAEQLREEHASGAVKNDADKGDTDV